jgi:hypothetical protein
VQNITLAVDEFFIDKNFFVDAKVQFHLNKFSISSSPCAEIEKKVGFLRKRHEMNSYEVLNQFLTFIPQKIASHGSS